MTFYRRGIHGCLDFAFIHTCNETTLLLYPEEQLPGLLCDGNGKGLHIVRTACGVYNLVKMAFLLKQELLVACYAFREFVGGFVRRVKRGDGNRIHACQCGRHGLGLAAEQVHMGVIYSLVEARRNGMCHHFACALAFGIVLLHNLCPHHACSTEFCQFHEIIG